MYAILGIRFFSSADVERSFSTFNNIKTFKRNRIKNILMNKLLRIKSMFEIQQFKDTEFLKKLINEFLDKSRRLRINKIDEEIDKEMSKDVRKYIEDVAGIEKIIQLVDDKIEDELRKMEINDKSISQINNDNISDQDVYTDDSNMSDKNEKDD